MQGQVVGPGQMGPGQMGPGGMQMGPGGMQGPMMSKLNLRVICWKNGNWFFGWRYNVSNSTTQT